MITPFYSVKSLCIRILSVLILASTVTGGVITGVILDSELDTPVKNVLVTIENVEVFSDDSGRFSIDTDEVSIVHNSLVSSSFLSFTGASQSLDITFPKSNAAYSVEIRNVQGATLFSREGIRVPQMTIPFANYAQGMYVLTMKVGESTKHYWVRNVRKSYTIEKKTTHRSNCSVSSREKRTSQEPATTLEAIFTKAGYDTLTQEIDTESGNLIFKMDRFEFCGNDVKEGIEACDGDEAPCNILNPLEYALGDAMCDAICSGYGTTDCVPHPNTDVSGNMNGANHKKALDMTSMAQYQILQQVQVGMIEGNFHDIIDSVFDENGANGLAFNHITGSGPNSLVLHHEGKTRMLEDGDVLLVDIGAKYNDYCADVTRTYPVNGKFTDRQKEIYQLVLDAKNAAAEEMDPNNHSLNQMTTFVKNFFKASPLRAKDQYGTERTMDYFFIHGLCHYVGKNVHGQDLGFSNSEPVKPGRIFTIEPGLYIDSEGFGIRLEDTYIMTADGAKNIMPNIAIEVDHIEAIMEARELNRSPESYKRDYKETKSRSTHMNF